MSFFPQAVCCADKVHCCPEGTQCDLTHYKCVSPSLQLFPLMQKVPATRRAEHLGEDSWGEPDLPSAVCWWCSANHLQSLCFCSHYCRLSWWEKQLPWRIHVLPVSQRRIWLLHVPTGAPWQRWIWVIHFIWPQIFCSSLSYCKCIIYFITMGLKWTHAVGI